MPKNITTCFLILIALFWCQGTYSSSKSNGQNIITPLIAYRCDIAADIIVITNSLLRPDEAKAFKFSDKKGTYNPWDLVKIDRVINITTPATNSKIIKKCTLSSGVYTITIEPKIFSRELTSACGTSISGAITIEYDGVEIFEKKAFEDYCHGNAPIITRITVFGKTLETKIKRIPKYKFY